MNNETLYLIALTKNEELFIAKTIVLLLRCSKALHYSLRVHTLGQYLMKDLDTFQLNVTIFRGLIFRLLSQNFIETLSAPLFCFGSILFSVLSDSWKMDFPQKRSFWAFWWITVKSCVVYFLHAPDLFMHRELGVPVSTDHAAHVQKLWWLQHKDIAQLQEIFSKEVWDSSAPLGKVDTC